MKNLYSDLHLISKKNKFNFTLFFIFLVLQFKAQTPASFPYTEDFEGTHNFTFVNGNTQTNQWCVGTATNNGGSKSLYISNNNGVANAYDISISSVTHAFRDVSIPTGITSVDLSFDWRAEGDRIKGVKYDYLEVWVVPSTFNPVAGTQINAASGGTMLAQLNLKNSFVSATYNIDTTSYAGKNMRLVFSWINDNSKGSQPPAAIDNISLAHCTADAMYINNVKFLGTLDADTSNVSGYSIGGYANYTALLNKGMQIPGGGMNIFVGTVSTVRNYLGSDINAWVDWNKNGIFESSEQVYNSASSAESITFGVVVPLATTQGVYTMRITATFTPSNNNNQTCVGNTFTETEDYSFNVVNPCATTISSVTDGFTCGPGPVTLSATGNGTSYRWYTQQYGGTPLANPSPDSSKYTTPSISSTTTYYVTAVSATCESLYREKVIAKYNPTSTIVLTADTPDFCGENSMVKLTSQGDKEQVELLNEDFESISVPVTFSNPNNMGKFTATTIIHNTMKDSVGNTISADPTTQWRVKESAYVPNDNYYAGTWKPAISSGRGTNKFAFATSDVGGGVEYDKVETALSQTNSINTTNFLNLMMTFDLYYSWYGDQNATTKDNLFIDISIDGGSTWIPSTEAAPNTNVKIYDPVNNVWNNTNIIRQRWGIGTRFSAVMVDLSNYKNQVNLKFRFRYKCGWGDGLALDNVRIYGDKPLATPFSWSVSSGSMDFYQSDCVTPLTGTAVSVCAKPNLTQLQNNNQWNIIATAKLQNGCNDSGSIILNNNTKFWDTTASTNWGTINWQPSTSIPTSNSCIIIKQPVYILSGTNGVGKNMKIFNTGKLTIKSGGTLTITDFINNNAPLATDFTIESDASLIQRNDGAEITGNATVLRNLKLSTDRGRQEYNYIASPVSNFNLRGVYPGISYSASNLTYPRTVYYNESNDYFYNSTGAYIAGRGLGLKEPSATDISGGTVPLTFIGVPYNTPATFLNYALAWTNASHGYNLVGNPYPSNIDLNALYVASTNIESTFKFWDNSVNNIYDQRGSLYQGYCYAIYNAAAGTNGTGLPAPGFGQPAIGGATENGPMPTGTIKPNNIVKVGQGFITRAKGPGAKLVFKNSERLDSSGNPLGNTGSYFYQEKKYGKTSESDDSYYLMMSCPSALKIPNTIIYFPAGDSALSQDDSLLDASPADAFYSYVGDNKVLINGRSNFVDTDVIDLGASYNNLGTYTISLFDAKGIFANGQNVYLYDKVMNTYNNLLISPYTFNISNVGVETGRFQIVYQLPNTLNVLNTNKEDLLVYRSGNDFVIKSSSKEIDSIEMYDASGRMITSIKPNKNEAVIKAENVADGTYFLKIFRNEKITSRKIIK